LRKAHNAANEQATLNVPTEHKVVQRLNGEGAVMVDIFIVAINSKRDLLGLEIYRRLCGCYYSGMVVQGSPARGTAVLAPPAPLFIIGKHYS
jgi:hypothetical protein